MQELIRLFILTIIVSVVAGGFIGAVIARVLMAQRLARKKVIAHESASLNDVLQFAYAREIMQKTRNLNTLQAVVASQPPLAL